MGYAALVGPDVAVAGSASAASISIGLREREQAGTQGLPVRLPLDVFVTVAGSPRLPHLTPELVGNLVGRQGASLKRAEDSLIGRYAANGSTHPVPLSVS